MSYALSFSEEFFVGHDPERIAPSPQPTSVLQAIHSLQDDAWRVIAREVFGVSTDRLAPEAVLARVIETNACSNLDEPVEVWIDPDGCHTLAVYSAPQET